MKIFAWIGKYKYLILILLLISYLSLSENNLFLSIKLKKEIKKLEKENQQLLNKNEQMKKINQEINKNKDAMELYMREYYFLKKENEEIFRIIYVDDNEK
ncbi:MAG TPA: septum formation initiator family protein [Bacteroidales bacterium]|nr:septum formation initiator family protein [Bacteroidales bacterium]HON20278.1 septum formation initiator family protein [Bacteroidales bacterium]HOR81720.1 septum formation initiator family protein [Bacteroidales bacterium]HPJ91213.1 septum formation initiator family protein [Bacteroidales bacterium]HQB20347.1 septum formation initiator family protein [Bacteroidales bacterium]